MFKRKLSKRGSRKIKVGDKLVLEFMHQSKMICLIENLTLVNGRLVAKLNALDFGTKLELKVTDYIEGIDVGDLAALGVKSISREWLRF